MVSENKNFYQKSCILLVVLIFFSFFFLIENVSAGTTEIDVSAPSMTESGSWGNSGCGGNNNRYTSTEGAYIQYTGSVLGGYYTWSVHYYKVSNRGIAEFYIDGSLVNGAFDQYDSGGICPTETVVSSTYLAAGSHTFKMRKPATTIPERPYINVWRFIIARDFCGAGQYYVSGGCTNVGAGYYSPAGDDSRYTCAAGYYCSTATNSVSTGNGQCTAGYYCTAGSTSATQNVCGAGKYCAAGSSSTTNCDAGYYGSSTTNSLSTCNGQCNGGYYCNAGSSTATQNVCGAGKYCSTGSSGATNCNAGYYCSNKKNVY